MSSGPGMDRHIVTHMFTSYLVKLNSSINPIAVVSLHAAHTNIGLNINLSVVR